jgi:flagellin
LDDAISQVSEVRSRLGAYQNRLEYAVSSLDGTQENMESAISRIMDTDMAEEMTTYANLNVLDQAAISVLTQANDMPQAILQMLD